MRHDFWTGQDRTGQDRTGQDRTGQDSLAIQFDHLMVEVLAASQGRLPSDIGCFMNHALTIDTKKHFLKSKLTAEEIAEIMIDVGAAADHGSVVPVDEAIREWLCNL